MSLALPPSLKPCLFFLSLLYLSLLLHSLKTVPIQLIASWTLGEGKSPQLIPSWTLGKVVATSHSELDSRGVWPGAD